MSNASAAFDALQVSAEIDHVGSCGAGLAEVHAFAYFGCLLSVYDQQPPQAWGYRFHATPAGSPYSPELDQAIQLLLASGLLLMRENSLLPSDEGSDELDDLRGHARNHGRRRYLDSATATAVYMPLPAVTSALAREPQLEHTLGAPRSRDLLDETGVAEVSAHFALIADAFDEAQVSASDLVLPASIWLMALGGDEDG